MAFIMNLKTVSFLLILLNYYDCLPQSLPPQEVSDELDSSFQQQLLQTLPSYINDLNLQKIVASSLAGSSPTYLSNSPRKIVNNLGAALQKLLDLLAVPPETCEYVVEVLKESQKKAGEFSDGLQDPRVKNAGNQVLQVLQGTISRIPKCSRHMILEYLTQQLQQIPGGTFKVKDNVVSGSDISTILLELMPQQGSSRLGNYLDKPVSQIVEEFLLQLLAERLGMGATENFSNLLSGFGQGLGNGFKITPYAPDYLTSFVGGIPSQ